MIAVSQRDIALPVAVRWVFNDDSTAFFFDRPPRHPNDIVRRVLSGVVAAAIVRYADGSTVTVRRRK